MSLDVSLSIFKTFGSLVQKLLAIEVQAFSIVLYEEWAGGHMVALATI